MDQIRSKTLKDVQNCAWKTQQQDASERLLQRENWRSTSLNLSEAVLYFQRGLLADGQ